MSRRLKAAKARNLSLRWGAVSFVIVLLFPLAPWLARGLWACPWKTLTGLPGPFCGTTRAALALARFDLAEAFGRYPLLALGLTFFIVVGFVMGFLALVDRVPELPARWPRWVQVGLILAVFANWVLNITTGV